MEERVQRGQRELDRLVVDAKLCTGCGSCVGLCPYRRFYRDRIVTLFPCDREEGRCFDFCPRTPADLDGIRKALFEPADTTPELGAVKAIYLARATREKVRSRAQHGGTVSTLLSLALKEGLIDAAVVTDRKDAMDPFGVVVTDPERVVSHAGSSFVVSPSVAAFNRAVRDGFANLGAVALPCQALAYAKMRVLPEDENNPPAQRPSLVIGLFCSWAFSRDRFSELARKSVDPYLVRGMDIPPKQYGVLQLFTGERTVDIGLEEAKRCIRGGCHYCFDLTAEFSDISVGSALLEEDWESARGWNTVIVRTRRARELLDLARKRRMLECREIPSQVVSELKKGSLEKRARARRNLVLKSGREEDLVYLDPNDPMFSALQQGA